MGKFLAALRRCCTLTNGRAGESARRPLPVAARPWKTAASVDICKFNAVWLFVAAASVSLLLLMSAKVAHTGINICRDTVGGCCFGFFFGLNVILEENSNVFVAHLSAI